MEGIGKVTEEITSRLVRLMPEDRFTFLFDRPYDPAFIHRENIIPKVVKPPARHPLLIHAWLQWGVKQFLRKSGTDLFLSFDGFMPRGSSTPSIITIHDLAYVHFPGQNRTADLWYYRHFMPKFAKEARHIITVSEFSKQDICSHLGVNPEKVTVIYNGVDAIYQPANEPEKAAARKKYALGKDYFLYLGSIHPRKNVAGLIRAFSEYKEKTGRQEKLLISGRRGWLTGAVDNALRTSPFREDVLFTDYVPREETPELIAGASALMYVSFLEGFGLPILEAMACGVPVICSDRNAMAEVAGDCALLVDPSSTGQIAGAMAALASSPEKARALREMGLSRAASFRWDKAAVRYRDLLTRILSNE